MNFGKGTATCAVCGGEAETKELYSTHFFGYANLDGRADDGTLEFGVTKCPHCGYVASYIEEENEISKDWKNIKTKLSIGNLNTLSDQYYALYKIAKYQNNLDDEYEYLLSACWAEEDNLVSSIVQLNTPKIIKYRNELIDLMQEVLKTIDDEEAITWHELREIDFLRRNKRFNEAIDLANKHINSNNETYSSIAKYQIKLCNDKSTKIETIDVAIKYSKDCDKYSEINNKLKNYDKKEQIINIIKKILNDKKDDEEFYRLINTSIDTNKKTEDLIKSLNALAKLEVVNHEFK